jgi:hypothetical protein
VTDKERGRRWREANREYLRGYQERQRRRRRELLRAYDRAYYAKRRARIRVKQLVYSRGYRTKNRALLAKKQRQRVAAAPEKRKEQLRVTHAKRKASRNAYQAEWRALVRKLPGIDSSQLSRLRRAT